MNRAHARSGFTILEVLVAMAILLFGMTTILGLLTYGTALSRTAQLKVSAASAAQAVVADLEESLFPDGPDGPGEPREVRDRAVRGVEGLAYSASARANPDRADEYRVDVDLRWTTQGVRREKRFTTLLYREVPFGERLRRQATPAAGAHLERARPDAAAAPALETPR